MEQNYPIQQYAIIFFFISIDCSKMKSMSENFLETTYPLTQKIMDDVYSYRVYMEPVSKDYSLFKDALLYNCMQTVY